MKTLTDHKNRAEGRLFILRNAAHTSRQAHNMTSKAFTAAKVKTISCRRRADLFGDAFTLQQFFALAAKQTMAEIYALEEFLNCETPNDREKTLIAEVSSMKKTSKDIETQTNAWGGGSEAMLMQKEFCESVEYLIEFLDHDELFKKI